MRKLFTLVLFFSVVAMQCMADRKDTEEIQSGSVSVRGRVVDQTGAPLPGVSILLVNARTGSENKASTDEWGRYLVSSIGRDEYHVKATLPSFSVERATVDLRERAQAEVNFVLKVEALSQGITVTASRNPIDSYQTPMPVSVLDSFELKRSQATNIAEALIELPGVYLRESGPFRKRPIVRGLDSNRILVLVDGERLNNSRTSTAQAGIETSLVDINQVERIEVTRGPGSVLYGSDALGGIINIITSEIRPSESGFALSGNLRTEFNSNSLGRRGHLELNGSCRKLSFKVAGTLGKFDNYHSPRGEVFNSRANEGNLNLETGFYPSEGQTLYAKYVKRAARNIGVPSAEPNPEFFALFPFNNRDKISFGYRGNFRRSSFSYLSAKFYFQNQKREFFNLLTAPRFSLSSSTITDTSTFGFDAQANSVLRGRHFLTYGVGFYRDTNEDERIQIIFPNTPRSQVIDRAPSVPNSFLSSTGLFLQDEFYVAKRVNLVGGIRVDIFRTGISPTPNFDQSISETILEGRTDKALSGNIAGTYDIARGLKLSASLGRAFREPNLFERFFFGRGSIGGFVVPNPDLKPESSLNFEAGAKFRNRIFNGSVTYFNNLISDLISSAPATFQGQSTLNGEPIFRNVNIKRARIQGMEAEADFPFRARWRWTPYGRISYLHGTNVTDNQPLPLISPLLTVLGLRWQSGSGRLWNEAMSRIVRGSDRVPSGFNRLQGFTVFSFRGGVRILNRDKSAMSSSGLKNMSINYAFENFTDKVYRELFNNVLEQGFNFRLSINLGF